MAYSWSGVAGTRRGQSDTEGSRRLVAYEELPEARSNDLDDAEHRDLVDSVRDLDLKRP